MLQSPRSGGSEETRHAMDGTSCVEGGFQGHPNAFRESQEPRAGSFRRDLPCASRPGRATPPLDIELDLRRRVEGFCFVYPFELHYLDIHVAPPPLPTRNPPDFSHHDDERDDGDMSMVSDAGLLSHPDHAYADHNVISHDSLSVPATARDANMDTNLEVATGEDALAPAAVSTAPAIPGDHEQTTSHENSFTPQSQSVPAVSADLPPIGLDAPIALDQPVDMHLGADFSAIDSVMEGHAHVAPQEQRLSAFARLRFRDGSYYMHTYQIILGRNVELAHRDMARLHKAQKLREAGDDAAAEAVLKGKKRKRRGPARSVVSASGGIVKVPAASLPLEYQHRRQSVVSHSLSSSSHPQSGSGHDESPEHAPQEVLMQTFDEVPEHLDRFVPEDPNDCPLVPIHPQHVEELAGVKGPKGISREHAKIFYNFDRGGFDLHVLSRNGLFHEGQHVAKGETVELDHGEKIEIGLVEIKFFLPDVALTEEQRARQESTSRPMSFSFENGQGELESEELLDDSASEDVSINPKHVFHMPMEYDSEDEGLVEEQEEEDEEDEDDLPSTPEMRPKKKKKQTVKLKLKNKKPAPPAPPVKDAKRGHKRKAFPEPEPPEPPAKKPKSKPKEAQKELPKEKAKAASKEPAKELPQDKAEASKTPKSASPVLSKKPAPIPDIRADFDDIEFDGIITAELVQRHNLSEALIGQPLEKRKGPGRPPKDGVMSKRQRSQLLKLGKEMERAKAAGEDPPQVALAITKPKAPRPRKDSNPEGDDEDVKESIEKTDGEGTPGDRKQARPNKPAREPSPPMRIEDYTEEQLQRPSANYVVLIHEAISSAKSGQMNLQQIYSYIERHYPWYKFKTTTSGWQSSVRHNLGQHEAFMKGDKEGKGYNWKINPTVSIEKERRKRQVSPPQANQAQRPYYPPANGYPAPYGQPGNYYPGMPPQGHPPNGVPPPSVAQPRLPPSLARSATTAAAPTPSAAPNPSPYASPWAGGKPAGSPPNSGPPSYPPAQSQTPPVTSAPTYGVLYPTTPGPLPTGYAAASPYAKHGPAPGTSPYANTPGRPYTPYATTGAPPASTQTSTGPPQPPVQASVPTASIAQGSHDAHASGRYPAGTNQSLVSQLEAFRDAYLRSMPKSEKAIDAAIQAFIQRDPQAKLGDTEQHLLNAIKNIPTIQALDPARQAASSAVEPKVKAETNGSDVPVPPQNPIPDAEQVHSQVASTAAAIAASDAAVEAATSLPAVSPTPPAAHSSSITAPASSQPQVFMPNMSTTAPDPVMSSNPDAKPESVPAPIRTQAARPSVEPLTPVPGSPAMPNGPSSIKKEILEKKLQDAIAGAKDLEHKAQEGPTTEAPPSTE